MTTTTTAVPIASFVRHGDYQVRARLDPGTVKRYATAIRSGEPMPPVKLARVDGVLVLIDGYHRVEASERVEVHEVDAEIVGEATPQEARWWAAEANLRHGLPLKSREVRSAFRAYIKAKRHRDGAGRFKSYREIAADLGGVKHYTTIRNWMRRDFSGLFQRYADADEPPRGGEAPVNDGPPAPVQIAREAIGQAIAVSRAEMHEVDRGGLIDHAAELLEALKGGGPWSLPDF